MKPSFYSALLLLAALLQASTADEAGFAGTWKLNLEKSELNGQSFSVEEKPSGLMHLNLQGFAFDFDFSGKEFPTPDGGTVIAKEIGENHWEFSSRVGDALIATHTLKLNSPDQATLTTRQAEGGKEHITQYKRASKGSGLLGSWISTEASGAPPTIVIGSNGPNELEFSVPEFKFFCKAAFDGQDYPVTIAGNPIKQTMVLQKENPRRFTLTTKIDGKPFSSEVFLLSKDGKILTNEIHFLRADEKMLAVFEKQ